VQAVELFVPLPSPHGLRLRRPSADGASTEASDLSVDQPGSKTRPAATAAASRPLACFPDLLEDDHRHRFRRPYQGREKQYSLRALQGQEFSFRGQGFITIRRKSFFFIHLQQPKFQLFEFRIVHGKHPDFHGTSPFTRAFGEGRIAKKDPARPALFVWGRKGFLLPRQQASPAGRPP
jgi:hypothetical protein